MRLCTLALVLCALPSPAQEIRLEAERPARQQGSIGRDTKAAASGGEVLGLEFGARAGHFAEYRFELERDLAPAEIVLRYARHLAGDGFLRVEIDGRVVGKLRYTASGGWGETPEQFRQSRLRIGRVARGEHRLRITVLGPRVIKDGLPGPSIPASPVLDLVGGRDDKNSVGGGRNVALFTGRPSRFFYATHELGPIFNAVDGGTVSWYPDHIVVTPEVEGASRSNVNIDWISVRSAREKAESESAGAKSPEAGNDGGVREQRRVCVTRDDVIVSEILLYNPAGDKRTHRIEVLGDCRGSRGWRGKPGGEKTTRRVANGALLVDRNVFPGLLERGLSIAVSARVPPDEIDTSTPGAYRLAYDLEVPAGGERRFVVACAIAAEPERAMKRLFSALAAQDIFVANRRQEWQRFFLEDVPQFRCSDAALEELYAFRWFLLRFSTTGGKLGYFKHPVVLEGRQAYQTYCCYSAPYMAFDLNWAVDPDVGYGHLASMTQAAYPDGRLPWYTAPDTNEVPLHHRSRTGLSLLAHAAWKHYLVHGRKKDLINLYPGLKRNVEWWIRDRDADGDGLFVIDHQLETGMDDLLRWPDPTLRYDAVDATSYAYANIRAVANMARILNQTRDHARYQSYAEKIARALHGVLWDDREKRWRDRHPTTKELSPLLTITTFYPFFAGAARAEHLGVFTEHLLDEERFWLPHPVPALAKNQPGFGPRKFWKGPSWPAATCHVVEAFAMAADEHDRSLRQRAADLLLRAVGNHLRPRPDFYERYDPLTGLPLSSFRDYMHSWWIDLFVRHIVGMRPREDGSFEVAPLPLGLEYCEARGLPHRGARVDISWARREGADSSGIPVGLRVRVDGETVHEDREFDPGEDRVVIPSR